MASSRKYELKARAYTRVAASGTATRANSEDRRRRTQTQIGEGERILSDAKQQLPAPGLTGGYEEGFGAFTLKINQAGDTLALWLHDRSTRELQRFVGFRAGGNNFDLFDEIDAVSDSSVAVGRLLASDVTNLGLQLGESTSGIKRVSKNVTPNERAYVNLPEEQRIAGERQHFFPLLNSEKSQLLSNIGPGVTDPDGTFALSDFETAIAGFFDANDSSDLGGKDDRLERATKVDKLVAKAYEGIHPEDAILAEAIGQQLIWSRRFFADRDEDNENREKKFAAEWLQGLVTTIADDALGDVPNIRGRFKIKPNKVDFQYKVKLSALGASKSGKMFGGGGFYFELKIKRVIDAAKKTDEDVGTVAGWMAVGTIGFQRGTSVGFSTTGSFSSPNKWGIKNFLGTFTMLDGSESGFRDEDSDDFDDDKDDDKDDDLPTPIPPGGEGSTRMLVHGNGEFPEIAIEFNGDFTTFGVELGVQFTAGGGWLNDLKDVPEPQENKPIFVTDHQPAVSANELLHFDFGSAVVTAEGRRLLGTLCARELSMFLGESPKLSILGHADRVDTKERNEDLSQLRGENAIQVLRDALGNQFRNTEAVVKGLGEQAAKDAGDKDDTFNPLFRKVELIFDARLVLTMLTQRK